MSVEDRLKRIAGLDTSPRAVAGPGISPRPAVQDLDRLEPVKVTSFPLDHNHGKYPLGAILEGDTRCVNPLAHDLGIKAIEARNLAFLDTETTGLGGGAGCLVFLAGIGFFRNNTFVVEQHLLKAPGEELPFLKGIRRTLQQFPGVSTYFGKAFDRPRLEDRFTFNRMPYKLPAAPHLDLCTLARRLWGDPLSDCKLRTLEEEVLGVEREDDVPGALCPEAFRCYLNGDPALMFGVLEHNLDDILSLVTLAHAVRLEAVHPASIKARILVARGLEALGRPDRALQLLKSACAEERSSRRTLSSGSAATALGAALKRRGDLDRAVDHWCEMARAGEGGITPLVELAKYFEHQARDVSTALRYTLKALETCSDRDTAALQHRAERLGRKMEKTTGKQRVGGAHDAGAEEGDRLETGPGSLASRLPLVRPVRSGFPHPSDLDPVPDNA